MLALHVAFPNCWNGRDLDSADHRSHMAYGELGLCPPSHPVEVPTINLNLRYPVRGGPGFELASGGQLSGTLTSSTRGINASSSGSSGAV